jgi:anti-sigma-K factor RskA
MNQHPIREEDLDLYALGALDGEDKRALEAHVPGCGECAHALGEARGRMALVALTAPAATPGAAVKQRLMQRVRESAPAKHLPSRTPAQMPAARRSWWSLVWAPAAVALALATLLLWVQNNRVNRELASLRQITAQMEADSTRNRALTELLTAADTQQVALAPAAAAPGTLGHVQYNQRQGALIYTGKLPALPAGKSYQLWLVPAAGNAISAGVFSPDATGRTVVVLPSLQAGVAAKAFAVTIEPSGGSPGPTGAKVLIGVVS